MPGRLAVALCAPSGTACIAPSSAAFEVVLAVGLSFLEVAMDPRRPAHLQVMLAGESILRLLVASALIFAFLVAYGASLVEPAPIIGAYAAGLILEPVNFQKFADRGEHGLEELVSPWGASSHRSSSS